MLLRYSISYSPISLNNVSLPLVFRETYQRLDSLTEATALEIDLENRTYRFLSAYYSPLPCYDYVNIYILGAAAGCRLYACEGSEAIFGVSLRDNRRHWFNSADRQSKAVMDYLRRSAVKVESAEDFRFLRGEEQV